MAETAKKRLIRLPEVLRKTGVSQSWVYEEMPRGGFPKSVPIGRYAVGWLESEIDAWIDGRVMARESEQAEKPLRRKFEKKRVA